LVDFLERIWWNFKRAQRALDLFFSILKWLFVKFFLCFCFFAFVSLKAHFLEKKGFKKEKEKEKEKKYVRAQAEHKHR
jgi:hypothetical protein